MSAIRLLFGAAEAGLAVGCCGMLRMQDGRWWDGKAWGDPPHIPPGTMPALVCPLAPLSSARAPMDAAGLLASWYYGRYPTDGDFGPVNGSVVAYIWNLNTGKFEGILTAQLVDGDDGPPPPWLPGPIAGIFTPTPGRERKLDSPRLSSNAAETAPDCQAMKP